MEVRNVTTAKELGIYQLIVRRQKITNPIEEEDREVDFKGRIIREKMDEDVAEARR